jgi:hypothetical protein
MIWYALRAVARMQWAMAYGGSEKKELPKTSHYLWRLTSSHNFGNDFWLYFDLDLVAKFQKEKLLIQVAFGPHSLEQC